MPQKMIKKSEPTVAPQSKRGEHGRQTPAREPDGPASPC